MEYQAEQGYYQHPKLSIVHEEEYEESVRDSILELPIENISDVDNMDLLNDDDKDY